MTPVGVFFICQNEDKCHFVNSTVLRHIFTLLIGIWASNKTMTYTFIEKVK